MTIKDHIEGMCTFVYYRDSSLWYRTANTNLVFNVPIDDIGGATFNTEERGILMMRYIRKYLAAIEKEG